VRVFSAWAEPTLGTFIKPMSATDHHYPPLFPQAHLLENALNQEVASLSLERKNIIETCRNLVT
jgi:hypothetical protein